MKLSIPEAVGDLSNLEGILSTKLSRDVFRTFLANEWSNENVDFYLEVQKFREALSAYSSCDAIVKDMNAIITLYVLEDARSQVNISSPIMAEVVRLGKTIEDLASVDNISGIKALRSRGVENEVTQDAIGTIFDHASKQIFNLMSVDSLPRFHQSEAFVELLQKKRAADSAYAGKDKSDQSEAVLFLNLV